MVKDNPIKDKKWYSNVNKVAKETGMPYFLLWANFSDTNFYIPYKYNETKGQELVNEFIDFYSYIYRGSKYRICNGLVAKYFRRF